MQEVIEVTIFRYRYLEDRTKVIEVCRVPVKLKPFLAPVAATIDLSEAGNELPPLFGGHSFDGYKDGYKQSLSLIPTEERQFGEYYDGQFFPHGDSFYDAEVHHSISKEDKKVLKKMWSFEVDVPGLAGTMVTARFKKRFKRGTFLTVLQGEGMWMHNPGGQRGNLHVKMTIK
jgi:hypothetical protein